MLHEPACRASFARRLPWGLLPSSRHQPVASSARSPTPHGAVRDVSHVLDGLFRNLPCGSIAPRNHVQGSPFRGFPSRAAVLPRRQPCPLAVDRRSAASGCPGAPPFAGPVLRAFIRAGIRLRDRRGLAVGRIRSPPGLRLLRVCLLGPSERGKPFAPLMTFPARPSLSPLPWAQSVLLSEAWSLSPENARPARGSWPASVSFEPATRPALLSGDPLRSTTAR